MAEGSQPSDSTQTGKLVPGNGNGFAPVSASSSGSSGSPGPVVLALGSDMGAAAQPDDKTVISNRPPVGDAPPPALPTSQSLGKSLVGKRLEHYELVEFVGGGGMGAVFRANDSRLGRTVAVKVLSRDHTDEETIRRFKNEAQSAARLDHPNIARVHYVGEDSGWNFIVFEFIEGTNLRDVVDERGPLPLADALHYTLQVAEALIHSSSRDVVHRDIKPSNVLLTTDGAVKLVDMGLARLHQVESSSDDLTASGVTLGTFDYISPEQARDPRSADVRSDIYSLGCTLYYLLVGRPPFPDGTALQKLLRHNADEAPDPRHFRPELSPKVTQLLHKMLAKRPTQRQQSASELVSDIVAVADHLGLADLVRRSSVVVAPVMARPQFWSQVAQVALAVVVLVAAIVVLDTYAPRSPSVNTHALRPKFDEGTTILPTSPTQPRVDVPAPESVGTVNGAGGNSETNPPATPAVPFISPVGPVEISPSPTDVVRTPTSPESPAVNPAALDVPTSDDPTATGSLAPPPMSAGIGLPGIEGGSALALGPPAVGPAVGAARVRRLVVARQAPAQIPPETEFHTSLATACRRAAELGLTDIDLAWTGPLVEPPLEIATSRMLLRAEAGYKPVLVFRPQLLGVAGDRPMIRAAGGSGSRLAFQGVELRMELPPEPSFGWSLIALTTGQTLELSDCILTVQDGDPDRLPVHDQVAMISLQPRAAMAMAMPAMAAGTTISLDRCIARGEATFLALAEDTPLSLRWNQGLLVTPRRLLETGGSMSNPKWYERINLSLDNVTASCRQGLFQMKRRQGAGFQFGLDVTTNHCILMTDEDAPLYDFVGVSAVSDSDLQCDGEFNRYPHASVTFLRVRPAAPAERPSTFDLENSSNWSMERRRLPGVAWRQPPAMDAPAHGLTKDDFLLDASVQADAGFDPTLLPQAGDAPAAAPGRE